MKKNFFVILLASFLYSNANAQIAAITLPKHLGTMYLQWGYNKDWFSTSDIHFKGTDEKVGPYDFTLHKLKAEDRPQFNQIGDWNLTIPQFYYRVGYFFNAIHMWGIEAGFDHVKYVMINNQVAHITGNIGGEELNKDTVVSNNLLMFEHTNGANFIMVSAIKGLPVLGSKKSKHRLIAMTKLGGGVVYPRTDVTIFGKRKNNVFHIAGYVAGAEAGMRYVYSKHLIVETAGKFSFANYMNVLTVGGDAKANHYFFCTEWLFSIGYQFAL